MLCREDRYPTFALNSPLSIRSDQGSCAINANHRHLTPHSCNGGCKSRWNLVEVGDDRYAGDKAKSGKRAPHLRKIEERRAKHHCTSRTTGDNTSTRKHIQNSLPRRRFLECLKQVARLPSREIDKVRRGKLRNDSVIISIGMIKQHHRLNRYPKLSKMFNAHLSPAFRNITAIG